MRDPRRRRLLDFLGLLGLLGLHRDGLRTDSETHHDRSRSERHMPTEDADLTSPPESRMSAPRSTAGALPPARVRCRSCGRKIDRGETFCPGCAHPQLRLCACGKGVSVHMPVCSCGRRLGRRAKRPRHPTPGAIVVPADPLGRWTLPLLVAAVVAVLIVALLA